IVSLQLLKLPLQPSNATSLDNASNATTTHTSRITLNSEEL
ncbi:9352_t:CDS:2, partial [Ambispora leptoticha]